MYLEYFQLSEKPFAYLTPNPRFFHYAPQYLSVKRKADYVVSEMAVCQAKYGTGYIGAMGPETNERKALEALRTGDVERINRCWAPWYTQHKIIAGLLDAWVLTDNLQAREVALEFAKWADDLTKELTEQQIQRMLAMEFGGIGESFENLYKLTKDPAHLALARQTPAQLRRADLAAEDQQPHAAQRALVPHRGERGHGRYDGDRALGQPRAEVHSAAHQPIVAAAAPKCVATNALVARLPAFNALPALKPNHPTQSRQAPMKLSTTLCGGMGWRG